MPSQTPANCVIFIRYLILMLVIIGSWPLVAQLGPVPTGTPFIRNISPQEYGAHNQNWWITQDHRGVMYFANTEGLLEYDGVSWRRIMPDQADVIRSLAADQKGVIYVGGFGQVGYLGPDSLQQLQFISLMDKLDSVYHNFQDVWQTLVSPDGIYFVSQQYIFRWNGQSMKVWTSTTGFHVGFVIDDQFYVREKDAGLFRLEQDQLVLVKGGERFKDERVMCMLPTRDGATNSLLLATRTSGLLLYDHQQFIPFATEADVLLKEGQVYCGTRLPGGHYAFGTLQMGIVVIDTAGQLIAHIDKSKGLQDETIWYLFPEKDGLLWAGMHYGISQIDIHSPFTSFSGLEGIEGSVLQLLRHGDGLYAASSMGAFVLESQKKTPASRFHRIDGVSPQCWALLSVDDKVIVGAFDGVYEVKGRQSRLIHEAYAMSLHRVSAHPHRILIGMQKGCGVLSYRNNQWMYEGKVQGLDHEILHIHETSDGHVWMTTRFKGLLQVDWSKGFSLTPPIRQFGVEDGLPSMERTVAFDIPDGLRFATTDGVYRYDEGVGFIRDEVWMEHWPPVSSRIFHVTVDQEQNLWFNTADGVVKATHHAGQPYQLDHTPFLQVAHIDDYFAYNDPAFPDLTWIGAIDRVIAYQASKHNAGQDPVRTLIRSVIINEDSLLYGGADVGSLPEFELYPTAKSIRIHYAAPTYVETNRTLYQYQLLGYDDEWSDWTTETYKDFTGLSAGEYVFQVRAKDYRDIPGDVVELHFRVLPPFYLSGWAWATYILLFLGLAYWFWKRQLARIRHKHAQELRQIELEKIEELHVLKSRFFTNISHEFRTPLTLILGPLDQLMHQEADLERHRHYHIIQRNATRMLQLINQLLDLSKLEDGKMHLHTEQDDLLPLIRSVFYSFESMSEQKKIRLKLAVRADKIILSFDREKMEQILTNLLANAIKFTPEGGEVQVDVVPRDDEGEVMLSVTDTGIGIAEEHLPHVFDRFYQTAESARTGEPGSGIGLTLVKELVELHQGRIEVWSRKGEGSRFSVFLPMKPGSSVSQTLPVVEDHIGSHESNLDFAENENQANHAETGENTLLLVEDNVEMRSFIKEILRDHFHVMEAKDGLEGTEMALASIPDIIISDIMMPRRDGIELCDLLKQDIKTSHIPIVLLTSRSDIESRLTGLRRGADDYLSKPFNREELLIRLRNLIRLRDRMRLRYSAPVTQAAPDQEEVGDPIEDAFLASVRTFIHEQLENQEFDIDWLARNLGMSRSQLFRKIKGLTGLSPSLFVRQVRLEEGRRLLETTDFNISEVAYRVGFTTPAYFSDAFHGLFGVRPSHFKK